MITISDGRSYFQRWNGPCVLARDEGPNFTDRKSEAQTFRTIKEAEGYLTLIHQNSPKWTAYRVREDE